MAGLKTASFTVRATLAQSARWKQAAEAHGHASVGTWLAEAADRHLEARRRAGVPLPLAWRRGHFAVVFVDGREATVKGLLSPPFAIFRGNEEGPERGYRELYTLVYLPGPRLIATLRTSAHCRALASDLSRLWVRWGGEEPAEDPAPLLQRFQREDV